jgi:voltage-gated potassium channel
MYKWQRVQFFNRIFLPIILLGLLILIGIIGYMLIEKYNFLEALYMTVITIASVGYEEVKPLSNSGMVFTVVLILVNLGLFTLFITLLTRYFVDGEFLRQYKFMKMQNRIERLQDHVIICGFGRNGRETAHVLHDNNMPFVVIENKEEIGEDLSFEVFYYLKGDATKDETLMEAGISKARALVTTLPDDADNLFVVLTARQFNPKLTIISRASQDTSVSKLKIAGATNVIMPDKIGGAHMATLVMIPDVLELISLMTTRNNEFFKIEELKVNSSYVLGELDVWKKTGCTVLGVKNHADYLLNPPPDYYMNPGERLIVMGSEEQIGKVKEMI